MIEENFYKDRILPLSKFYNVDPELILLICKNKNKKDRKLVCAKFNMDMHVFRTMMDYNRYDECNAILNLIKDCKFVLDFGCLVADYGMFFARRGLDITLCDKKIYTDFAEFRFKLENFNANIYPASCDYNILFGGKDLVIFGEVLEHMEDPLLPLNFCLKNKVKYIFTSRFPYGDENYYKLSGHKKGAQDSQEKCIKMLSSCYNRTSLLNNLSFWTLN